MPNWCESKIGFICDEANTGELKRLYDAIYNLYEKYGYGGYVPLEEIAFAHDANESALAVSGDMTYISDWNDGSVYFRISAVTPWKLETKFLDCMMKKYTGIRYVYVSEENSGGIYINTDREGICFPESYTLYAYTSNSSFGNLPPEYFTGKIKARELFEEKETFNNFKELREYISDATGRKFDSIELMNSYFREAMEKYDGENDNLDESVVEIHKYATHTERSDNFAVQFQAFDLP